MSETALARERLSPYCKGIGLDLGYGGDSIVPQAITMDIRDDLDCNLRGDARNLFWFRDGVLDFIYSSHLLEDFEDTESVLIEWLRVLKAGGLLIIYCPVEKIYREHCVKTGQAYNIQHKQPDFSLQFIKNILQHIGNTEIIHENPLVEIYSFELVAKKL